MKSELLWVSVPGGITERAGAREAVLRVLIAPRLQGSSLAAEGMDRWPPQALVEATLAIDFCKTVDDAHPHTVNVAPPHIQAQPGIWEAFFGPNMTVKPFQPRMDAPQVEVDNTSAQAKKITDTFGAAAGVEIKAVDPTTVLGFEGVVRTQLEDHWRGDGPMVRRAQPLPPSSIEIEPPDFHRTISLLREHPAVLHALGLIIELRVPASELPHEFSEGFVQVRWPGASALPALPEIVSPWTRYGSEFRPGSTENISAGMVTLTNDLEGTNPPRNGEARWQVFTVDVDGGARRLRDAARALATPPSDQASPTDATVAGDENRRVTLPALRSAGLLLVRPGRQQDFAARRQAAATNAQRESMSTAVLTADDLVLGYRIDIKRFGGDWFSLMQREATYSVRSGNGDTIIGSAGAVEEGHVKAHGAVRESDGTLRSDEVVAHWTGWSLAVPRPTFDDHPGRPHPARRPGLPFEFSWEFHARKVSLPRLRFTNSYQMRARVADIAGGGMELDDPAAGRCATEPVPYRRYEPVLSPDVTLPEGTVPETLGPAESLDQVVIRSDPAVGMDVAQFAEQNPRYPSHSSRMLLPPRASLTLAEQHGVLDGDIEQTWVWVRRAMALADQLGTSPGEAPLPDPAARGVVAFLRREPGGLNADLAPREWSESTEPWPDLKPKSLSLSERHGEGHPIEWQGEQLNVRLAPAGQVILELSTFVRGDYLDHFAAKELLPLEAEAAVLSGRHPLLTPARLMQLVHAVRRPLRNPRGELTARREKDQTFALLDPQPPAVPSSLDHGTRVSEPTHVFPLNIDPLSTAKVEITGSWSEHNDEIIAPVSDAPVQSVIIGRGDQALQDPLRHEFGDTRHRKVTYTVTAVSRFRQFFHPDEDAEAFVARSTFPVSVLSSARPAPPIVLSTLPAFVWEQDVSDPFVDLGSLNFGSFHVQRRRRGGRLRVELQRPWYQTGEDEMLAVIAWQNNAPPPSLWPFVTQVGRDPIWDTTNPDRWPTQQAFRGFAAASASGDMPLLPEAGVPVVAVPYQPWFHEGRWFADIALPDVAASSYCPFVQLAVARYQPNSIKTLELSQVVHTEMVPLLPDRTLTVDMNIFDKFLTITLEGLGPAGPHPNRVDLIVEQCTLPPGMPTSAVDLTALEPAPNGIPAWVPRVSTSGNLGSNLALGDLGAGPLRLRVREIELVGPNGAASAAQAGTGAELTERTVFTDVLPLPDIVPL